MAAVPTTEKGEMRSDPDVDSPSNREEVQVEDEQRRPGYWTLLRQVPRLVARAGFRGLTHRALAKEAGVTRGLVSYYFESRDALIEAAGRLATEDAIARSELASSGKDVRNFAAGLSQLVAEDPDAQVFQYELAAEARRSEPLLALIREMYDRYVTVIAHSLDELEIEHDDAMARVIFAALDGLALQQLVYDNRKMTDRSVAALQELLVALRDQGPGSHEAPR